MKVKHDPLLSLGYLAGATRLRRIGEKLQSEGDKIYNESGLPFKASWFATYYTLIKANGPLTIQEIAIAIGFTHITVKNVVRELEENGIVRIKPNPGDARSKHVRLTAKGQNLVTKLTPLWQKISLTLEELLMKGHPDFINIVNRIETEMDKSPLYIRINEEAKSKIQVLDYRPDLKKYFFELTGRWLLQVLNGKLEPEDEFTLHNPDKAYLEKGGFLFFAKMEDKISGCTALKRLDENRFEFCKLYVNPEYRKSGIATQLIQRCITRCMENNADELWLQTTNEVKNAHVLYHKLGFKEMKPPSSMEVLKRTDKIMCLSLQH
jgi:DNA-binding MarR family transcriptional regulator/N-acetylglutamate synthase-like GNAT family acetyltransferase